MNFRIVLWALLAVFLGYALYRVCGLFMKKYFLTGVQVDTFQGKPNAYTPAPVRVNESPPVVEQRGPVTPGGPNPPNTAVPTETSKESLLPEERANDPMEQLNSSVPIKDNLRHPERMFNAGGDHSGTKRALEAGIAGDTRGAPEPVGKFSPEFAQNGGEFMTGIFANDFTKNGGNYSEI
jgi:hypothetical protein